MISFLKGVYYSNISGNNFEIPGTDTSFSPTNPDLNFSARYSCPPPQTHQAQHTAFNFPPPNLPPNNNIQTSQFGNNIHAGALLRDSVGDPLTTLNKPEQTLNNQGMYL